MCDYEITIYQNSVFFCTTNVFRTINNDPTLVLLYLLLGDLARFSFRLVRRPQDARCLLHDSNQQVVDVVLQLTDVRVLFLHHLLLLDQLLHNLLEREAAVRRHAALELIRLLQKHRARDQLLHNVSCYILDTITMMSSFSTGFKTNSYRTPQKEILVTCYAYI